MWSARATDPPETDIDLYVASVPLLFWAIMMLVRAVGLPVVFVDATAFVLAVLGLSSIPCAPVLWWFLVRAVKDRLGYLRVAWIVAGIVASLAAIRALLVGAGNAFGAMAGAGHGF